MLWGMGGARSYLRKGSAESLRRRGRLSCGWGPKRFRGEKNFCWEREGRTHVQGKRRGVLDNRFADCRDRTVYDWHWRVNDRADCKRAYNGQPFD